MNSRNATSATPHRLEVRVTNTLNSAQMTLHQSNLTSLLVIFKLIALLNLRLDFLDQLLYDVGPPQGDCLQDRLHGAGQHGDGCAVVQWRW